MNRLKIKRREAGIRQVDLARLSGVSIATIWSIEQGLDQRTKKETRDKIVVGLNLGGVKVEEKDIFPE